LSSLVLIVIFLFYAPDKRKYFLFIRQKAIIRNNFLFNSPLDEGKMPPLDVFSLRILSELQRDARQTILQIASRIGLTSTPCWKRVKEMESNGVIRGYTALVDRDKVGLMICVLAEINLTRHTEKNAIDFEKEVAACPQITECYSTTGNADYMIKVVATDIKAYEAFMHSVLFKLPGVDHVRSSIVLREVKYDPRLPLA
jgi:Lrp/AsnC family transcriptional regulator, leucine-responsive regulatory protein